MVRLFTCSPLFCRRIVEVSAYLLTVMAAILVANHALRQTILQKIWGLLTVYLMFNRQSIKKLFTSFPNHSVVISVYVEDEMLRSSLFSTVV